MEYTSKRKRKTLQRIKRTSEGDANKRPYSTADDKLGKKLEILSRGGKVERSHKKRVGNKIHKNLDNKLMAYQVLDKMHKRINDIYNRRK